MKKALILLIIVAFISVLASASVSAGYKAYGSFKSCITTAVFECYDADPADDIRLAAEGCRGSDSLGARTASYDHCKSGKKTCWYFNIRSTYGYYISGGAGLYGYVANKGYVYN